MLKLLTNITSTADDTNYLIGNFYQLLKFIITNVSTSYVVCGLIIVMCMFATTFKNLIYKVLNLAVLSVFVVALWAYMTDVTFIYVVYILTFVSAVVMLFLSVVLMLPSSAIAVAKRNLPVGLLAFSDVWSYSSSIVADFARDAILLFILSSVIYFVWYFFTSQKHRRIGRIYGSYGTHKKLSLVYELPTLLRYFCGTLANNYRRLVYIYSIRNTAIAADIFSARLISFMEYILTSYEHIKFVCSSIANPFKVHPGIIFKLSQIDGFELPLRYLPAYYYNCAVRFVFNNIEVPLSLNTTNKSGFHFFARYYNNTAVSARVLAYNVRTEQYLTNDERSNKIIFIKNFISFVIVNILFTLMNAGIKAVSFFTAPAAIELSVQVFTILSVFFIAVPAGLTSKWAAFTYSPYLIDAATLRVVENLAAIQQGLYVDQPLLLLVSITGLLVALIGAPFFVSRGNK